MSFSTRRPRTLIAGGAGFIGSHLCDRFLAFLAERFPDLKVPYHHAPPFRPLTEEEDAQVVQDIVESGARILFVGIGCPKQEKWMAAHKDRLPVVQVGVGAAFDFHSGAVKQAPGWMGRAGLEWLFRLMMEPKRLWKRYILLNPRFMARAAWQLLHGPKAALTALLVLMTLPLLGFIGKNVGSPEKIRPGRVLHVDIQHPQATDRGQGTANRPFRTISAALASGLAGPADTIMVAEGLYREELHPRTGGSGPSARLVIRSVPGEEVTISGADPNIWPMKRSGNRWLVEQYPFLDYYGDGTTYERELVVADDRVLRPVFSRAALQPGTFFVERFPGGLARIHIDTGSSIQPTLQMARRGALFFPGDPNSSCNEPDKPGAFHLIGLTFRHAANAAQFGAVCLSGSDSVLEDVTVEETIGTGILVTGERHRLERVRSNHNGQAGINGSCVVCTIKDSETSWNNFVGHDPFWEAGGGKWAASAYVQFIRHQAIGNEGPGLWFDGDNVSMTVSHSLFDDNLAAGVFIELISEDVTVERSTISNTRRLDWTGAGILIQAAGTATLSENRIENNDGAGIWLRRDERAEGGFNSIMGNAFAGNGRHPGQDRADIQIGAQTLLDLCSNRLVENQVADGGSFLFEVDETGESYEGSDLDHFSCLVGWSAR